MQKSDIYSVPEKTMKLDISVEQLLKEMNLDYVIPSDPVYSEQKQPQTQLNLINHMDADQLIECVDSYNGLKSKEKEKKQPKKEFNINAVLDQDKMIEELLNGGPLDENFGDFDATEVLKEINYDGLIQDKSFQKKNDIKSEQIKISAEQILDPHLDDQPQRYVIDYIDELERDPYKFYGNGNEHVSYLFTHTEGQLKRDRIETFKPVNIDKVQLALNDLYKQKQNPKCIQYYQDTLREVIAVGTSKSNVMLYLLKCPTPFQPLQEVRLPTDQSFHQSSVVSIEFTDTGLFLLSINMSAQVMLFSLSTLTSPKLLKVFMGVHSRVPITMAIFGAEQMGMGSCNNVQFVSCDNDGIVQTNRIRKSTFSYGIEKSLIFSKNTMVHQLARQQIRQQKITIEAIAMAGVDLVQVVVVEPFLDIVFKRPYQSQPPDIITVKWYYESGTCHLMLSDGQVLEIVVLLFKKEENKVDLQFQVHSRLKLNQDAHISSIHWLSANILFAKVERRQYYLLDITKFTLCNKEEELYELSEAIILEGFFDFDASDQIWYLDTQYQGTHSNTIINKNNTLLVLESFTVSNPKTFIQLYQLSVWNQYILQKISNLEWNVCLALCIQVYSGKARYFASLPLDEQNRKMLLQPFMNETILRYIKEIADLQQQQDKERWQNKITTAIEFLVKCNSLEFLFTTLRATLKKHKKDDLFLECLETFILRNQIKYIPRDALREVMSYLKIKRKLSTLKQLIINLDISLLDPGLLVQECIEYNLYTPLIYVSTFVNEDYFTPIVKMFATYTSLMRTFNQVKDSDLTFEEIIQKPQFKQFIQDQEIKEPQNSSELLKEIQLQGYRCLWYIHMCFIGIHFPQGQISQERWGQVLMQMMIWVFAQETLSALLELSSAITLKEFMLLFGRQQQDALRLDEENTIQSLRAAYKRNNNKISMVQEDNLDVNKIVDTILEVLCHQLQDNQKIKDIFGLFLGEVLLNIPHIRMEHAYPAIIAMLKQPYTTLNGLAMEKSYQFIYQTKKIPRNYEDAEEIIQKKQHAICSYLIVNENLIKNNQYALKQIYESALDSPFVEVRCQVNFIQKEYTQCIDQLIHSSSNRERIKVFDYIQKTFRKIQEHKQLKIFMKHLLTVIKNLIVIDADKVSELLDHYPEEDFKEAIFKLNEFPDTKYRLLWKIVAKKRRQKESIEDKIMIDYFDLTCRFAPERAQEELKHGDFPQDDCLKICRIYKIQAGEAYLMEKSGSVQEAINLYFDIFITSVQNLYQLNSPILRSDILLRDFIFKQLTPCLDICRENNKRGDEDSENNWFLLIIRITKLRQKYFSNQQMRQAYTALNNVYQTVLGEILNKVELKSVLQNLEELIGLFNLTEAKTTYQQLLSGYSYEKTILDQALKLIQNDVMVLDDVIFKEFSRGFKVYYYDIPKLQKCYVHRLCEHMLSPDDTEKICGVRVCLKCCVDASYEVQMCMQLAQVKTKLEQNKRKQINDQAKQQFNPEEDIPPQQEQTADTSATTEIKKIKKNKCLTKLRYYDDQRKNKHDNFDSLPFD